jgi:hypothetical protein
MWRQNQNNFKNLDELTNLPGETTADKVAMWQRLESRLQKKPQKKKVIWYWAAACLLICTTVPFLFNSNKYEIPTAAILNNTTTTKSPISRQPNKTVVPENIKLNTTEIKLLPIVSNVPSRKTKIQRIKTKQDSFVANTPLKLDLIVQETSPTEMDTLTKKIAITIKKKIHIVHVNELIEEDRIAEQNVNIAKTLRKKRTKIADKFEYAGTLNFRIYFKN